jgi:hypothetical protein
MLMETTDNPMNVDFVLTAEELRKFVGKWITFKIWNCSELDQHRIYKGEVIQQSNVRNCYMCQYSSTDGKCSMNGEDIDKCSDCFALVETTMIKEPMCPEIKIRLFCNQIIRGTIRILPPEEVLIMKLEKEQGE